MRRTGMSRAIDPLGRIVLPKEIRDSLNLTTGVRLDIGVADDKIILSRNDSFCACCGQTHDHKHLDGWDCKMSFTALGTSPENIKLALGAATVSTTKVTPNRDLKQADFSDIWWAGDRADGGVVAACLKNALSTGGFTLKTTKNGKGQVSVELTGHVSIEALDTMPMEFYSIDPTRTGASG